MKTLLITIITGFIGLTVFSTTADAKPRHSKSNLYHSGYTNCGCAIYTKQVLKGYDRFHRPIYKYVKVPTNHRCRGYSKRSVRNHYYATNYRRGYSSSYSGYRQGYSCR